MRLKIYKIWNYFFPHAYLLLVSISSSLLSKRVPAKCDDIFLFVWFSLLLLVNDCQWLVPPRQRILDRPPDVWRKKISKSEKWRYENMKIRYSRSCWFHCLFCFKQIERIDLSLNMKYLSLTEAKSDFSLQRRKQLCQSTVLFRNLWRAIDPRCQEVKFLLLVWWIMLSSKISKYKQICTYLKTNVSDQYEKWLF